MRTVLAQADEQPIRGELSAQAALATAYQAMVRPQARDAEREWNDAYRQARDAATALESALADAADPLAIRESLVAARLAQGYLATRLLPSYRDEAILAFSAAYDEMAKLPFAAADLKLLGSPMLTALSNRPDAAPARLAVEERQLRQMMTVRENIAVPLQLNGASHRQCWQRVDQLLDAFGFRLTAQQQNESGNGRAGREDLATARIDRLSGGEYQRVSLARAIAHRPRLVFVDEPTAALNRELARGALKQFQHLQQERTDQGATLMITHDEELADEFANLVIRMAPRKNEAAGEVVEVVRKDMV